MSVIIAVIGVVNPLSLSIVQPYRELGLLRAGRGRLPVTIAHRLKDRAPEHQLLAAMVAGARETRRNASVS
jgi:hypothetical protein